MNDEIAYALFLLFSVAAGYFIQYLPSSHLRKRICGLIGFCSSLFFCRYDFWYALAASIGCAIICSVDLKLISSHRRILLFSWAFCFLTVFRLATWLSLPIPCALANAVQLVLTLKIVGIGGEIVDSHIFLNEVVKDSSQTDSTVKLKRLYRSVNPSFMDIICYLYSYAGMFTGPYYTYRTWNDAMEKVYLNDDMCSVSSYIRKTVVSLLSQTTLCGLVYFLLIRAFPFSYFWSLEWSISSCVYRLLYLIPVFSWFRLRFYSAWLASEAACVSLGLGVYPAVTRPEPGAGPTDLVALHQVVKTAKERRSNDTKPNEQICFCSAPQCTFWASDTVHNISIYACECSPTVSGKLRAWNRTVQYWLVVNVYQRCPRSWPRPLRAFITVFVSAYWHGLHAGYYLSFGTAGAFLSVERVVPRIRAALRLLSPFKSSAPSSPEKEKSDLVTKFWLFLSDWISGFWSMRVFEYMAVGFYTLSFTDTTRIWSDVYYSHHIFAVLLFFASFVLPRNVNELASE